MISANGIQKKSVVIWLIKHQKKKYVMAHVSGLWKLYILKEKMNQLILHLLYWDVSNCNE